MSNYMSNLNSINIYNNYRLHNHFGKYFFMDMVGLLYCASFRCVRWELVQLYILYIYLFIADSFHIKK